MNQVITTVRHKKFVANPLILLVNKGLSEKLAEHAVIFVAILLQKGKNIFGKDARETRKIGHWFAGLHKISMTYLKIARISSHMVANTLIQRC